MTKAPLLTQYFEFVRFALNPDGQAIPDVKELDWDGLYVFANEQAIVGVLFEGVKRIGEKGIKPPFDLLMNWIGSVEQIEWKNKVINKKCLEVQNELQGCGFENCIIKGQGNALNYPNPYSRASGDIDIIIRNADRKELTRWVSDNKRLVGCHFQHAEYEDKGIGVELHFVPCYVNNPIYHRRLQKWFATQAEKDDIWNNYVEFPESIGSITIPSVQYNLIHQLAHMMHHFFDEGIGLRQMMDYYFVLKALNRDSWNLGIRNSGYRDSENLGNTELGKTLRYLGLWKFAGAVMYVMREVFALEPQRMIAPVDERRGKTLLAEILKGGNFGKYSGLTKHSAGGKYFAKTWRNIKFVREYPAEALCEPFFRTWHFFWRIAHR